MRIIPVLILLGVVAAPAEDLTTLDKKTYRDVTVRKVEADALLITHAAGGGKVAFTNLDEATRQKYNYDPAKAAAAAKEKTAAAKPVSPIKNPGKGRLGLVYRLDKLEEAQAQAQREGKPIAFLMADPAWLEQDKDIRRYTGSHAATVHFYELLKTATVIVFIDSKEENHQGPQMVDAALHGEDDPARIPPKVAVVDAAIQKVHKVFIYVEDPAIRQRQVIELFTQIRSQKK
jgi:hypothetical protein